MKKFETNKIYCHEHRSGIGYDEICTNDYYLIIKQTDKTIWYKKIRKTTVLFGTLINDNSTRENLLKEFEKNDQVFRSKNDSIDDSACFRDQETLCKGYVFVKYCIEK